MTIRPYENKNGYPAVAKRIYCDNVVYEGKAFNSTDEESLFLKYKLLKHVINNHVVLSGNERHAKGLASLEMCKEELKNLHKITIGNEVPFEDVQFAVQKTTANLKERQAKRQRYNQECVRNLVTSNDLDDVLDTAGIIQAELNEEMDVEFLDATGRTPTDGMDNLRI